LESYLEAFQKFVALIPEDGLIVANAADEHVVRVVDEHARAQVAWFALEGEDTHGKRRTGWPRRPVREQGTRFDCTRRRGLRALSRSPLRAGTT